MVIKFSGPLEHPGHQNRNQEREQHFERLAPSLNKARKEPVFPLDDIDTHREHFRVSEITISFLSVKLLELSFFISFFFSVE